MLLRICFSLTLMLTVFGESASAGGGPDSGSWNFAPLQYSHIVIRGVVTAVEDSVVAGEDFWVEPKGLMPPRETKVLVVRLRVSETLRGPSAPNTWSFVYWSENPKRSATFFPIGKEMLICAEIHPRLGVYYYSGRFGQYIWDGREWQASPGQKVFDDSYLRTKIREAGPEQVASQAELVFVGTVASIEKSSASGPSGEWAEKVTLSMKVEEVKKGTFAAPTMNVVMLTRGSYAPSWRQPVPDNYTVGQRWLCFVRHGDAGWYPFAGSNGLLRVENDHLVYGGAVPYWHTAGDVDNAIRSARKEAQE